MITNPFLLGLRWAPCGGPLCTHARSAGRPNPNKIAQELRNIFKNPWFLITTTPLCSLSTQEKHCKWTEVRRSYICFCWFWWAQRWRSPPSCPCYLEKTNTEELVTAAEVCSESTQVHSLPEELSVKSEISMVLACHSTDFDAPSLSSEELPSSGFFLVPPPAFLWTVAALLPHLPGSGLALGSSWLTCRYLVLFITFQQESDIFTVSFCCGSMLEAQRTFTTLGLNDWNVFIWASSSTLLLV